MNKIFSLFATTPKGLELLLVDELRALGAKDPAEKLAGVAFSGDLALAYKACLWSRLANRILLRLTEVPAETPEALYQGVQSINWLDHLDANSTLAVHLVTSQSKINHSLFGAQKVKDAIVDQLRDRLGERPNVARQKPDVQIHVYLHRDKATISIDLSGESLHKRGYRLHGGQAPLKENLAAGILLRAKWPEFAKKNAPLLDPMCGSGTLLVEGALIAGDVAPGLLRDYFGFLKWKQHDASLWEKLLQEAKARRDKGLTELPAIIGYDQDADAITASFEHIERAGLHGKIHVEKRDLEIFAPRPALSPGLVVVNPPYGERLGEVDTLKPLYTLLGDRLKTHFLDWHAAVFTGNPDLGKEMGLRAHHFYALFNGAISCKLLLFSIEPQYFVDRTQAGDNERKIRKAKRHVDEKAIEAVQMFVNRLNKNLKHLQRKARREGLEHYRIYDADLPEYAFAIDITLDGVHVQEYKAPKTIDEAKVLARRQAVLAVLPEILQVPASKIFFSIIPRG